MEKIKVKSIVDRFDKNCRKIVAKGLVNGKPHEHHVMNIWRHRDWHGTWWESDRFSNIYDTVAKAKAHVAELAAAGQI